MLWAKIWFSFLCQTGHVTWCVLVHTLSHYPLVHPLIFESLANRWKWFLHSLARMEGKPSHVWTSFKQSLTSICWCLLPSLQQHKYVHLHSDLDCPIFQGMSAACSAAMVNRNGNEIVLWESFSLCLTAISVTPKKFVRAFMLSLLVAPRDKDHFTLFHLFCCIVSNKQSA